MSGGVSKLQSYMKTFNNVAQLFQSIANAHQQVHTFGSGEVWSIDASTNQVMPTVWLVVDSVTVGDYVENYTLQLLCFDLVHKDETDLQEALSDTQLILLDFVKVLKLHPNDWFQIIGDANMFPFTERFGEDVAGWRMELTLQVDLANGACDMPIVDFVIPGTEDPDSGGSGGGGSGGSDGECCTGTPNQVLFYDAAGNVDSNSLFYHRGTDGRTMISDGNNGFIGVKEQFRGISNLNGVTSDDALLVTGDVGGLVATDYGYGPNAALLGWFGAGDAAVVASDGGYAGGVGGYGRLMLTANGVGNPPSVAAVELDANIRAAITWNDDTDTNGIIANSLGLLIKNKTKTWAWPTTDGAAGTVLKTDGAGNLSWVASGGGGSGISIGNAVGGGTPTQILYVDSGGLLASDAYHTITSAETRIGTSNMRTVTQLGRLQVTSDVNHAGAQYLVLDPVNHAFSIGDIDSYSNGTQLVVDDSSNQRVYARTGGEPLLHVTAYPTFKVSFGAEALRSSTGDLNVAFGAHAGRSVTSGQCNTLIGAHAGQGITTAEGNIMIGTSADVNGSSIANSICIGMNTAAQLSHQMVIGALGHEITEMWFGQGVQSASTPPALLISATRTSGNNIQGGDLSISAGQSTGSAAGGWLYLKASKAGPSGGAANTVSKYARLGNGIVEWGDVGASGQQTVASLTDNFPAFNVLSNGGGGGIGLKVDMYTNTYQLGRTATSQYVNIYNGDITLNANGGAGRVINTGGQVDSSIFFYNYGTTNSIADWVADIQIGNAGTGATAVNLPSTAVAGTIFHMTDFGGTTIAGGNGITIDAGTGNAIRSPLSPTGAQTYVFPKDGHSIRIKCVLNVAGVQTWVVEASN